MLLQHAHITVALSVPEYFIYVIRRVSVSAKCLNKFHRPKGRCIGFPESKEGTPQGAGNIPAVI